MSVLARIDKLESRVDAVEAIILEPEKMLCKGIFYLPRGIYRGVMSLFGSEPAARRTYHRAKAAAKKAAAAAKGAVKGARAAMTTPTSSTAKA